MLSKIADIWRNNYGSTLTIFGLVVALVMSVASRYDLVPTIGPPSNQSPTLYGRRLNSQTTILVVSIRSQDFREGTVVFQVVGPPQAVDEPLVPIFSRTVKLQDGLAEFVVTELARGTFAAFAFLDPNDSQELVMDQSGLPTEPYGFARPAGVNEPKLLADGVFELTTEPVFIKIQLRKPLRPVRN